MSEQLHFDFMDNAPQDKPNPNVGRVLTVKLKITDPSKAETWLWNMKNNPELGIHISGLSNGDMFAREALLEKTLGELEVQFGQGTDLFNKTFDKLDAMMLEDMPELK